MANKRTLVDAGLEDSTTTAPPIKKPRMSDHSSERENENKITLKIDTKLGNSDKLFQVKDLQMIAYFNNQLSGRWETDSLNINGEDLCFGMDQIEAIIYYKKQNIINVLYPYSQLIYLCNAFDYFAENISSKILETYFAECIPAIQYQNLVELRSLSNAKEYKSLSTAVDQTLRQISIKQNVIQNNAIKNWHYVPIKILTCNPTVAVAVFAQNFIFGKQSLRPFLFKDHVDRLNVLWEYIVDHKLYLKYPKVMQTVYQMKHNKAGSGFGNIDSNVVVSQITCDTLEICFQNNMKYSQKQKYALVINVFNIMLDESHLHTHVGEKKLKVAKEEFFHYDFLFIILKKLIDLREINNAQYQIHFGGNFIVALLKAKFSCIATVSKYREIFKNIQELKMNEKFLKTEKYELFLLMFKKRRKFALTKELLTKVLVSLVDIITMELPTKSYHLLKCILDDYRYIEIDPRILKDLLKSLIEMDYTQSFKLTKLWFPLFMKSDINWITKELPNKTSFKTLSVLIDGICEYITNRRNCDVDSLYLDFINQYTNAWSVQNN